jgi:hypothetical protein
MNIENETIEIYNSAIKQTEFLNLTLTKENIKKICEINVYAIIQAITNNNRILDSEKIILANHYKKISSKISAL